MVFCYGHGRAKLGMCADVWQVIPFFGKYHNTSEAQSILLSSCFRNYPGGRGYENHEALVIELSAKEQLAFLTALNRWEKLRVWLVVVRASKNPDMKFGKDNVVISTYEIWRNLLVTANSKIEAEVFARTQCTGFPQGFDIVKIMGIFEVPKEQIL